ncbi:MAG: PAS domain S-box protein [Terracidiphilus sp.]|nr:PAS domain S-box protein [Terracidiphilus sp.]
MKTNSASRTHREQFSKAAESHLRALIDSTSDVIWSVDLDYRLVTFNKAFADSVQLNWGVRVQPGMAPSGTLPAEAAGNWISLYKRTLAEGPTTTLVETYDGRCIDVTLSPIFEADKIAGISVIGKNITGQKRAEDRLRASEMRFRTLTEQAPSPIGISRNGTVLYVNRRFAKMFALADPQDAVGKPITAFWSPGWAQIAEEWSRRHSSGAPVADELEGVAQRADGTRFSVHVAMTRVELPDGSANVAFFTDISRSTANEAALRESEARFRSYFELPLVGMATTSVDKKFIDINDRFCEILGYEREELMGLDWAQITHPDDLKANRHLIARILSGEIDRYSLDKRFIRKDGTLVWTTISVGCVRKPSGIVDYVCTVIQDISDRKAAANELDSGSANCLDG